MKNDANASNISQMTSYHFDTPIIEASEDAEDQEIDDYHLLTKYQQYNPTISVSPMSLQSPTRKNSSVDSDLESGRSVST